MFLGWVFATCSGTDLTAGATSPLSVATGVPALALAAFTLMATFIALRFWELPTGQDRSMAMNAFCKRTSKAAPGVAA